MTGLTELVLAYFIANENCSNDDLVQIRVRMDELFDQEFMLAHTSFSSIDEMVEASPWEVQTEEDFLAIPEQEWSRYIKSNSDFSSWQDMFETAAARWIEKNSR